MSDTKPHKPEPHAVRGARRVAGLTQTEAADIVGASMRAWQQWESGERAMPPGLFELFMLKTRQWSLNGKSSTTQHGRVAR
jgi:DNA-binding transcriptional regulator YiaG